MTAKGGGNARTQLENAFKNVLNGDTLKNALIFAEFLEANDMTAREAYGEITYKGKSVCYMYLDKTQQMPGPWTIWTEGDYSRERVDVPIDSRTKEIAWANVNICANCGCGSQPGKRKTIFGREFDNVCNAGMAFYVPDAETIECVKKLLEMRKCDIADTGQE